MTGQEEILGSCPVDRGLMRVGDRWSILILRDIDRGLTRYEQLRTSLGIAPNIFSRRLAALTGAGLTAKRRYRDRRPRDEYPLTEAGFDFLPLLDRKTVASGKGGDVRVSRGGREKIKK